MKTSTTERSPLGSGTCSPFLTVTGADERTDVSALAKLDAEIGLLYTETPEGRNRYPRWEWIRETSLELRRASLHVCGRGARAKLMEGSLPVSGFQRIQVNGLLEIPDVRHLCRLYPSHTIITQHMPQNRYLMAVDAENHVLLVDGSGGRGISPESWQHPNTAKVVGFAGGLGPDNLAAELQTISRIARPGWWVDMEGKLRADDWFSVEFAEQCCAQFSSFERRATDTRKLFFRMKTKYDKDARDAASTLWAKLQETPTHQQHEAICAALKDYACEADKRLDESDWAAKYRDACIEISKHSDEIEAYRATIGRMEYKLEVRAREIEQIKDSLVECSKRAEKAEDTVRLLGEVDTARAWQFAAGNPSAALHKRMEFARAFFAAPSNAEISHDRERRKDA